MRFWCSTASVLDALGWRNMHKTGTAVVTLEKEVSDDILKKAVTDQGYQVTDIK